MSAVSESAQVSSMRWTAPMRVGSFSHRTRSAARLNLKIHRPVTENMQAAKMSKASKAYFRPAPESRVFCVSTFASPSL